MEAKRSVAEFQKDSLLVRVNHAPSENFKRRDVSDAISLQLRSQTLATNPSHGDSHGPPDLLSECRDAASSSPQHFHTFLPRSKQEFCQTTLSLPSMAVIEPGIGTDMANAQFFPVHLTAPSSSPRRPLPVSRCDGKNEAVVEEEERYPCLRRALSCTETPILPLGTYALEFGFDVTTLPFVNVGDVITKRQDALCSTESSISVVPRVQHENDAFTLAQYGSVIPHWNLKSSGSVLHPTEPNHVDSVIKPHKRQVFSHVPSRGMRHWLRSTNASSVGHCWELVQDVVTKEPTMETRDDYNSTLSVDMCSNTKYYLAEAKKMMEIEEELSPVSSDRGGYNEKTADKKVNQSRKGVEKKYADVFKKDSRTWLWKSSAKKAKKKKKKKRQDVDIEHKGEEYNEEASPGSSGHTVATHWKKDKRTWLWKSSDRKNLSEEEEVVDTEASQNELT